MAFGFLNNAQAQSAPTAIPDFSAMQKKAHENLEAEVKRIVDMPIAQTLSPEDVEMVSRHYLSTEAFNEGERLRIEQATAMVHYMDYGGIFVPLGVGKGKTMISFMIAQEIYARLIRQRNQGDLSKEPRILLVVQANLIPKFEADVPKMRWFLKDIPPYFVLNGPNKSRRTMLAKSKRRGLYVCSYHTLSSKDATDILEAIQPAAIICDEAHNVAGTKDSARAKRFREYVNNHQPEIIPLSGTMTRKSVMEYHYLAKHALGEYNFLPNSYQMAQEWGAVLDSDIPCLGQFRNDLAPRPGPINFLVDWENTNFSDEKTEKNLIGFRKAFSHRFRTTPGVICSNGDEDNIGAGLILNNNACPEASARPGWDKLQEHVKILTEDFQTPSGEELPCAMNVWGYRYQMEATGFYYDLYWREAEDVAKSRQISLQAAKDILNRSIDSHNLHKTYNSVLRSWLAESSRPHLDTYMLVGLNMKNHGDKYVGKTLYSAWKNWHNSLFDEIETRHRKPVRVCDFKVKACADEVYAKRKEGGIIWYAHHEMGTWMMEELKARGLEPVHCPSGTASNKYLDNTKGMAGTIIVAMLPAHCTGKDLQFGFCRNYFLQNPISATMCQQALGRTHRSGQYADDVGVNFYLATTFDHAHFNMLLVDAAYVQQTTKEPQKIFIGSYTFRPKSIPRDALVEMGARLPRFDKSVEKVLDGVLLKKGE